MTSGKELATLSIVKINGYSLELFSELDETLRNICKLKKKKITLYVELKEWYYIIQEILHYHFLMMK